MNEYEVQTDDRERVSGRTVRGMRPIRAGGLVFVGVAVILLSLVAGGILGHVASAPTKPAATAAYVYLTIGFNPYTGLDEYFPSNFSVPAGVPVLVTITNYDNGTNLIPADYTNVTGTVGNTETVNGASVSRVPADHVAHTFTLIQGPYRVNVPIPPARDQIPTVASFTVVFGQTGVFTWHCMAPCDGQAMATMGYMQGSVTVVGA